jgi:uncharacterized membrane protein YccC
VEHATPSPHPTHGETEGTPSAGASPQELAELRDALATQRAELRDLRRALLGLESVEAENGELRLALRESNEHLAERQALVTRLERVLEGMKSSVSWRSTRPLRGGKRLLRGRRG